MQKKKKLTGLIKILEELKNLDDADVEPKIQDLLNRKINLEIKQYSLRKSDEHHLIDLSHYMYSLAEKAFENVDSGKWQKPSLDKFMQFCFCSGIVT